MGSKLIFILSASKTSPDPHLDETALFPCFAILIPILANNNADAVEDPLVNTSQDIQIGGATWIPRYFNGKMACEQIYNTGLSHANIKQIYNAQKSRFGL